MHKKRIFEIERGKGKMTHVIIAVDCPPLQHKRLVDAMNRRKYHFAGKRKGYNIPAISEIKFYNIRVKKEIAPLLLSDLMARNIFSNWEITNFVDAVNRNSIVSKYKKFMLKKAFTLFRWFLTKFFRI